MSPQTLFDTEASYWSGSPGTVTFLENCRVNELARAGAFLPQTSSIELGIPLFCRDANGRDIISTTVAMLTGLCFMSEYAERMRFPFNELLV